MPVDFASVGCPGECSWMGSMECSACSEVERFVRHFMTGPATRSMTEEEREWCVLEADHCGEGMFSREELVPMGDKELARSVFNAWNQYANSH